MFTYKSSSNKLPIKHTREKRLGFYCNSPVSFSKFVANTELHKKVNELDKQLEVSFSLLLSFQEEFSKGNATRGLQKYISKEKISTCTEEYITDMGCELFSRGYDSILNDAGIESFDEKLFIELKSEYQQHKSSDNPNLKYKKKTYQLTALIDYMVFLYLTKKDKLFWCINTITTDINIVDTGNLSSFLGTTGHIIYPFHELLSRGDKQNHFTEQAFNSLDAGDENHQETKQRLVKASTKFNMDIHNLRKQFPDIGKEKVLSLCNEWLGRQETCKLQIEIENNYWLVRPTVKQKEIVDESITQQTNQYGHINIKKHAVQGIATSHVEYSPCYKVWKSEQE